MRELIDTFMSVNHTHNQPGSDPGSPLSAAPFHWVVEVVWGQLVFPAPLTAMVVLSSRHLWSQVEKTEKSILPCDWWSRCSAESGIKLFNDFRIKLYLKS